MVIFPLTKSHAYVFVIYLCICDSIAEWLLVVSPFIQSLSVELYLALLNLYLRDPSLERKVSFFLKVDFAVTFEIYLCNLGTFWVLTNWHRCRVTKVHIFPGENDKVWRNISVGKQEFLSVEKVVHLSWRLHCKTFFEY